MSNDASGSLQSTPARDVEGGAPPPRFAEWLRRVYRLEGGMAGSLLTLFALAVATGVVAWGLAEAHTLERLRIPSSIEGVFATFAITFGLAFGLGSPLAFRLGLARGALGASGVGQATTRPEPEDGPSRRGPPGA